MDREAWRAVVHGVTKSRTRLGDWPALLPPLCPQVCSLRLVSFVAMQPGSSNILALKIHGQRSLVGCGPWVYRVRRDWGTKYTFLHAPFFGLLASR